MGGSYWLQFSCRAMLHREGEKHLLIYSSILPLTTFHVFLFINSQKGGGTIDLEPCLTHTSTVEPTLAPVVVERTMTTRAAASVCILHHAIQHIKILVCMLCLFTTFSYSCYLSSLAAESRNCCAE